MTNETYKMLIELLEFECDKYNNVKLKNRKEYNHEYYLKITKPKRKAKKKIIELLNIKNI